MKAFFILVLITYVSSAAAAPTETGIRHQRTR